MGDFFVILFLDEKLIPIIFPYYRDNLYLCCMGKKADIIIKESLSELEQLYKKQKNSRKKLRIKSLILTKKKKFSNRTLLAEHLGVSAKTLYAWTLNYKKYGVEKMLTISNGGKRWQVVPDELHSALEIKLNDSKNPLLGYQDAVIWAEKELGIKLNYQTLRAYMKRHFATKLKVPRKSHYKKDEQAIEAFKKTTVLIRED